MVNIMYYFDFLDTGKLLTKPTNLLVAGAINHENS
jgi:hypothetical protein